jgi:hypothetical protein
MEAAVAAAGTDANRSPGDVEETEELAAIR